MSVTVTVKPRLLRWARERASLAPAELAKKVGLAPKWVTEWETTGELKLEHLERVAEKTHTPVGYLFLADPPEERLPVADFRRPAGGDPRRPSPDLLDTIYQCQQRQEWYREALIRAGEDRLPFIGSATLADPPREVASRIRALLGLDSRPTSKLPTWSEALRQLFDAVEGLGVLVMRNGVVGNNTHRKLDVAEFRGFALCDEYAPLIFVNAADSKSAQMFTLIHELGHLWLGESAVTDADPESTVPSERFCNAVAAEALVPMAEFQTLWQGGDDPRAEAERLARHFKVSTLVVLIRAREAGALGADAFHRLYAAETQRDNAPAEGTGGDFYNTQRSRLGKRFARAVIASALEGQTPYKEAFRLLGIRKGETFDELARNLGLAI
jgi:Zn-dependent peptidase ImmA (M78 family)